MAVVFTWNRKQLLARSLHALPAQTRPEDEVLVVDNGSSCGPPEMRAAEFPGVRMVRPAGNAGRAGGCRVGVREGLVLDADWIWLMDDHGVPEQGCMAELLRVASRENLALCGPLVAAMEAPRQLAIHSSDISLPTEIAKRRVTIGSDFYPSVDPFLFNGVLVDAECARKAVVPKAEMF